jgi:hypothetical protein
MHHRNKVDAPSGTAVCWAKAAAKGRDIALDKHWVKARDGHNLGPRGEAHRLCHLARRHGGGRAFGDLCRHRRAHHLSHSAEGPFDLRAWRA